MHWYASILLLAAIGSVSRETALTPAAAFVFANARIDWSAFRHLPKIWNFLPAILRPFLRLDRLKYYLPLAIGLLGIFLLHRAIPEQFPFYYLEFAARGWADTNDLRYLGSVIAMLGPIVFVALFRPAFLWNWFSHRGFYAGYMLIWFVLGYTNRPDERYFIVILPVLFLLADDILERFYEVGRDVVFWTMAFVFTAAAIRAYLAAPQAVIEKLSLPPWQEALARFLPQSTNLEGIWLWITTDQKLVVASLAVFLLMGWLMWLRAEACRKPDRDNGDFTD